MRAWSHVCQVALVAPVAFAAVGCDTITRAPDQDYRNFQTRIAEATAVGVTPYWLGREFTAGGLVFKGPSSGDFGGEVEGGGAEFHYDAVVLPNGGTVGMRIVLYAPAAWEKAKALHDVPPSAQRSPAVTVTSVKVAGADGRFLESHNLLNGQLEGLSLIVRLGDTVVLAVTGPGFAPEGGRDLNPLTDKQTFIAVLQRLRPYPQP